MDALFRKLPLFKGKQRLARLLLKKDLANGKDICVKGRFGSNYLLPNLIENVSLEIFINGIYEKATSDFFVKRLSPGGVFLDLGANIGAISVPLYQQRKDIKIVCVEAAPWLFPYLQKNLEQNGFKDAVLVNKALFNTDNEEIDFSQVDARFSVGRPRRLPYCTLARSSAMLPFGSATVRPCLILVDESGRVLRSMSALLVSKKGLGNVPRKIWVEFVFRK